MRLSSGFSAASVSHKTTPTPPHGRGKGPRFMGTHHAAATRRRAEREQKERYGLKHYRVAKRCAGCGCKSYVFNPLARVCFECAVAGKGK